MARPNILFLDAYDSFSNNIVSLLATLLSAHVDVLPIDAPELAPESPGFHADLRRKLDQYDAVVCGPGPGAPTSDADVGLMKHVWELDDDHLLPILGICLGFQSLAVSCGATVGKLATGLHGMVRNVDHVGDDVFAGVGPFSATLYHSLCADVGQSLLPPAAWPSRKGATPAALPDICPLAWVEEPRDGFTERILMAMRHRAKPFWGLQYHPESVRSEPAGHQVLRNWFREAQAWNRRRGRLVHPPPSPEPATESRRPSLLSQTASLSPPLNWAFIDTWSPCPGRGAHYAHKVVPLPSHVEVPDVVELLRPQGRDQIVLDSASAHARHIGLDVRGRYSIVALDVEQALRFEYHVGDAVAVACVPSLAPGASQTIPLAPHRNIWHLLSDFVHDRGTLDMPRTESPFVGGFMGYATYELGLEAIQVGLTKDRGHHRPDLCFAWITKSVVIDHLEGNLRIQNLHTSAAEAEDWLSSVANTLERSALWSQGLGPNRRVAGGAADPTPPITPTGVVPAPTIRTPEPHIYDSKVRRCQEYIAAGDSYELCLTDQTSIERTRSPHETAPSSSTGHHGWVPPTATKSPTSWQLYRGLRTRQPAPFGSYIRLGGATLVSSSPERFLEHSADGVCSMRPMKGTVRKSEAVATLEQAEKILHVPKEEAENLMIVDLVRHDLHSVCGPGHVSVPQLLQVEEYASVFQMISVVQGQLPAPAPATGGPGASRDRYTGLDVLAASLPPGSMTGAPKKRSCEILQELEGRRRERSLYSGVVGYMDATGRGDWSVTIRSLFRWDDEARQQSDGSETETWHIGAGGAVTALSTPAGETDEMFVKLKGPLGVFWDAS